MSRKDIDVEKVTCFENFTDSRNKGNMPKVGIAIPAYNVEKFIDQCLESILQQTYENIVIAVINDGSQDHTWEIIEKYMLKEPDVVRGINSTNKGMMKERKVCISLLDDCDYILFVDADDYLCDKHIVEKCVKYMEDADMVCFNMEHYDRPCFRQDKIISMTGDEGMKQLLCRTYFDGNITGGCYRYRYVKNNYQERKCNNDDYLNKAAFVEACNKIIVIPDIGYYYRVNNGSQTKRKLRDEDFMYYEHVRKFCADMRVKYPEYEKEANYFESWVLLWLASGVNKYRECKQLKIYKPVMKTFDKHIKEYVTNEYFTTKERLTCICLRLHIFGPMYRLYHKWKTHE